MFVNYAVVLVKMYAGYHRVIERFRTKYSSIPDSCLLRRRAGSKQYTNTSIALN